MALSDVAIESTSRNGADYFTFIIRDSEQSFGSLALFPFAC